MKLFLSYCRDSEPMARRIVADLASMGHAVWFDQALSGGQPWWDHILSEIRGCDLFVFLLHPVALDSLACTRERAYAVALGKPVLPIRVADGISVNLLPPDLARRQIVPYLQGDRDELLALARALAQMPPAPALPEPLPEAPEVPSSYLGTLAQRIEAPTLSYEDQSTLLVDLRQSLREPGARADAEVLLGRLRKRRDLFAAIADEIDALRERTQPPVRRAAAAPAPAQPHGPVPAPDAPPVPASGPSPDVNLRKGWHPVWLATAAGVAIGFLTAVLYEAAGGRVMSGEWLLIPGITGASGLVAGALAGRDRRSWRLALGVAAVVALGWAGVSSFGRDGLAQAATFGAGGGLVAGALIGRIWRWRRPG